MKPFEALAIVVMSMVRDRAKFDAESFCESKAVVTEVIDAPTVAIQKALKQAFGLDWDGKTPLSEFIIGEYRDDCIAERNSRLFRNRFNEVAKAIEFIEGHRRLRNVEPDQQTLDQVARCKKIISGELYVSENTKGAV